VETIETDEKEKIIIEVDKSFNVIPLIQAIIDAEPKIPIDDSDDLQFPILVPKKITKGQFARALANWFIVSAVPISNQLDLLIILEKHLSGVKLPIKKIKTNNYKSTINNYNIDVSRTLKFDICSRNGCMAFVGEKSKLKECEKCHQKRYRPCTKCKFVFLNSTNDCNHGISIRKPYKTVFYRPILPLIINLINTDMFLKFINYEAETLAGYDKYSDVQQGSNFKKNYREMEKIYNNFCTDRSKQFNQSINEIKKEITMVNILISQFYDGMQVYKKKVSSFWPLVITILNLPPNCRMKLGMGMFLVSIFTAHQGSGAEDFLFKDCYIKELRQLYDGYLYTNPKTDEKYLIQVRLIIHCYDTKAVEDHLHVQSCGSLAGCFMCNSGKGVKIIDTDTVVFIGNRINLPKRNYLRTIGQSEECCPPNYYKDFNKEFEESTLEKKASRKNTGKCYTMRWDSKKPTKCCTEEEFNVLSTFFLNMHNDFEFEHKQYFHPEKFEDDLWFHHCDFRSQSLHSIKKNQEYIDNSEIKKQRGEKEYKGVKGLWHEHVLPNVNIETDLMWDPFHVLSNIAANIIQNWKSERFSEKITNYNKKINIFPGLTYFTNKNNKRVLVPNSKKEYWFIDKSYFNELDAIINSLVVPSGFSEEFQCRNVFERTGYLNGSAKIQLLTVIMPLIMYHCNEKNIIKSSYIKFFLCVCFDINSLLSPVFKNENIEDLYKKVLELLCLHEGMFPITENKIIWHQIIDLPQHIPKCGTIKNWWAISGERCLHSIKQHLPKGGLNNELTVMSRYSAVEDERVKEAYRTPSKVLSKLQNALYDDRCIKNINEKIYYSNTTFKLFNVVNYNVLKKMLKKDDEIHNEFEVEELLKVIIVEIMKKTI